jgi:hypothetical protein
MLLGCPWLRDAKISHDWGTNIVIIQRTFMTRTKTNSRKLNVQTKRQEVLICCDFHFRISDEEEDVMFAIELDMFSIGTKKILSHIEPVSKPIHIPYLNII